MAEDEGDGEALLDDLQGPVTAFTGLFSSPLSSGFEFTLPFICSRVIDVLASGGGRMGCRRLCVVLILERLGRGCDCDCPPLCVVFVLRRRGCDCGG